MMQWIKSAPVALFGARADVAVIPFAPPAARTPSARAAHAEMLAAAALRRQRAQGEDAMYWRAMEHQALARARQLREERSFAPLP